jgi:hypothetical protein
MLDTQSTQSKGGAAPAPNGTRARPRILVTYDYKDEKGRFLYQTVRYHPKGFKQRRPDKSGWVWNLADVPRVLYRLPELLQNPDRAVFVVEGEKDADRLREIGLVATTNVNGANAKWLPQYTETLRGREVVILPDNDEPGRRHAEEVAAALDGAAASVKVVPLPGLPLKGDVSDWLDTAGNDKKIFLELVLQAPNWWGAPSRPDATRQPALPVEWEEPVSLGGELTVPPFPINRLPGWLARWGEAKAEATQTPSDLAAMLSLAVSGAALAKKFRVQPRPGWSEPTNICTVTALPSGDRKSEVYKDAMAPVLAFEQEEVAKAAPIIAEKESEHRVLEARIKSLEARAAKEDNQAERDLLKHEARQAAKELAAHVVPAEPQFFCDDVTPEHLGQLIAQQGGRMLQAAPEGTALEIAKGRYSETANFDVYLKGHAGDPLRVGRVSRARDTVDQPALSLALAVQPDVIRGLNEQASMRGRGFLARLLYSVPVSRVGSREIAPRPVPEAVSREFSGSMLALWRLTGTNDEKGNDAPHWLRFSREADELLRELERWLEPQLAQGEPLSHLAGWANKLAGAVVRLAGILHIAEAVGRGERWSEIIEQETVSAAIAIGRDYLLPHAIAAFGLMGTDDKIEAAKHLWGWIVKAREDSECSERGAPLFSRRDLHQGNRRRFPKAEDIDPVIELLAKLGYIRPEPESGTPGRGHRSPTFQVNPLALAAAKKDTPRSHRTHCTHSDADENDRGDACEGD